MARDESGRVGGKRYKAGARSPASDSPQERGGSGAGKRRGGAAADKRKGGAASDKTPKVRKSEVGGKGGKPLH